jgi:phosphatidylglycerol lysyltransferase
VAFLQLVITSLDLLLAGAVLYCLLGSEITIPFALFLNAYLLAQVMGLFSQIPGGLGVFEGVFIYLLGADYPSQQLIVALLLYRIIYYFIPLMIAGAGIVAYEVRVQQWLKHPAARFSMSIINDLLPQIFSVMMLLSGTILLFSGSTPAIGERLEWLGNVIGLPMIELSNMAGSIIGFLMLILAYAIRERVGSAWYATVVLLIMGIIFCLAKGFDYEEAFILFVVLIFFLPNRKLFYRHSALLNMQLSPSWLAVIVTIVSTAIWLGFFSYKHVEYSQEMWWQFGLDNNASRFMRISLVLIVLVAVLMFQRMLMAKPRPMLPILASQQDIDAVAAVITSSQDAQHCVALTGDKSIMWSDDGRAFIAFGVTSRFWVAVGNPCGPLDACQELIWKFREEADLFGAKVAFYQVTADDLPLYIDLGLSLVKFGEQARVDLSNFSLEGRPRAFLRQRCTKFFKEGCTFSILQTHELDNVIADLKAVSDEWIHDKNANEKGFSLGFFDKAYLKRMPVAIVKKEGVIVAFANIWHVETKEELSIDLMRYSHNAPANTMEFLFAQLMVWGRENGYRWFNLGMAPLAGLEEHRLAPRWHRWGNALFKLGNEFYNFEGLRFYKNKFDPVWTPRYLAAPPGIATADVLLQVTRLINGGSPRSPSVKIENAE